MNPWSVNLVTAFGRGEHLAQALHDNDFNVDIYDLTEAFPFEYRRGAGPFPVAKKTYLPAHEVFFQATESLPKGLVVWTKEGPFEFAGSMASFYIEHSEAFRAAVQNSAEPNFEQDWLRRLLRQWASPYYFESWSSTVGSSYPVSEPLVVVPRFKEKSVFGLDLFQNQTNYHRCTRILDVQIESGHFTEMEIESGRSMAVRAPQWVWCLSSQETELLNPAVAETLFSRDVRRAEWLWISMSGEAERGPWSEGFPRYSVVVNDIYLPWTHANLFVLEWLDDGRFEIWLRVPSESVRDITKRSIWASESERVLNQRLAMGKFRVDPTSFGICPHSLVFPEFMQEWNPPGWKNWDWIAPETMARLDFGARFEKEMASYQRLMNWRNDLLKKQGARGDQTIHAP